MHLPVFPSTSIRDDSEANIEVVYSEGGGQPPCTEKLLAQLYQQKRNDKNKTYSIHEPTVNCINKEKVHKRYKLGNKVSIIATSKSNWILSAQGLENPYDHLSPSGQADGHTLANAPAYTNELSNTTPKHVYCDKGYPKYYRSHK